MVLVPNKEIDVLPAADYEELRELKEITLNKATVSDLSVTKVAAAAFLVDYDDGMWIKFHIMKLCISKFFKDNPMRALVLVTADEPDVREIMEAIMDAICENGGDWSLSSINSSVKVMLSSFMERIRNNDGRVP